MATQFSLKLGNGETLNGFAFPTKEFDATIKKAEIQPSVKEQVNVDLFEWSQEVIEPKTE